MLHSTSPDGLDVPFGSNCIVSYCDFQAFQKYAFKISSTCTFIYNFQGFPECLFVIGIENWVRTLLWPLSFKETKMSLPRSLVKIQYCGEPPCPRGSVLGLKLPGLQF